MIKLVPEESAAVLEKILAKHNTVWCFCTFIRSDAEKLTLMRKASMGLFQKNGVADDELGGMPTVLVKTTDLNLVYAKSPVGWVDLSNANAKEIAEVALGMLPQSNARQVFNPTGSLLGDLALSFLAGVGQALTEHNKRN